VKTVLSQHPAQIRRSTITYNYLYAVSLVTSIADLHNLAQPHADRHLKGSVVIARILSTASSEKQIEYESLVGEVVNWVPGSRVKDAQQRARFRKDQPLIEHAGKHVS
jgi:hypothetical protein